MADYTTSGEPDIGGFATSTFEDGLRRPAQFDKGSRGAGDSMGVFARALDSVQTKTEKISKFLSGGALSSLSKYTAEVKEAAKAAKDLADQQARLGQAGGVPGSTGGSNGGGAQFSGMSTTTANPGPAATRFGASSAAPKGSHFATTASNGGYANPYQQQQQQQQGGGGNGGGMTFGRAAGYAALGTIALAGARFSEAEDRVVQGDLMYNQIGANAAMNGGRVTMAGVEAQADNSRAFFANNRNFTRGSLNVADFQNGLSAVRNAGTGAYTGLDANGQIGGNLATQMAGASSIASTTGVSMERASAAAPNLYRAQASHALLANGIRTAQGGQQRGTDAIARDIANTIIARARGAGQDTSTSRVQQGIMQALSTEGTVASRGLSEVTGGVGTDLHNYVIEAVRGQMQGGGFDGTSRNSQVAGGVGASLTGRMQDTGASRTQRQSELDAVTVGSREAREGFLEGLNDLLGGDSNFATGIRNFTDILGQFGSVFTGAVSSFGAVIQPLALYLGAKGVSGGGLFSKAGTAIKTGVGATAARGAMALGGGAAAFGGAAMAVAGAVGTALGGFAGNFAYNNSDGYRQYIDDNFVGDDNQYGFMEQSMGRLGALMTGNIGTAFSRDYNEAMGMGDPPLPPGMDSRLQSGISALMKANPKLRLNSGPRSAAEQGDLYAKGVTNVPPGHRESRHERGLAADLGPTSEHAWLAENAPKVGLEFPHRGEPWHVEVAGTRDAFSKYRSEMGGGSGANASNPDRQGGSNPYNLPNYPVTGQYAEGETGTVLAAYLRTALGEDQARITSAFRPGATTASGNVSNHRSARAIDIAGPSPTNKGWGSPGLKRIFDHFWRIKGSLQELILSGTPAGQKWITSGRETTPNRSGTAWRDHWDHVHVATHNKSLPFVGAMLPENSAEAGGSIGVQSGMGSGSNASTADQYGSVSEAESIKALLSGGRTSAGAVINNSTTGAGRSAATGQGGGIEQFLRGLRQVESSDNYTARNPNSSATGAYQYLKGTWANYGGYREAAAAPPEVQDRRAREDRLRDYNKYGSWRAAAVGHIYPAYADDPAEWDITLPGANAGHTGNTYASKVLDAAGMVGDPPLPEMPTNISMQSAPSHLAQGGEVTMMPAYGSVMGSGVGYGGSGSGGGHGGKCIHIESVTLHAQLPDGREVIKMIEAVEEHAERRAMINQLASS